MPYAPRRFLPALVTPHPRRDCHAKPTRFPLLHYIGLLLRNTAYVGGTPSAPARRGDARARAADGRNSDIRIRLDTLRADMANAGSMLTTMQENVRASTAAMSQTATAGADQIAVTPEPPAAWIATAGVVAIFALMLAGTWLASRARRKRGQHGR